MQQRLARDPVSALGLPAHATADDVRTAFLELTKTYHPVRFGRMASDIQKLSNEVFLALRAAHDALAKAKRRQTGPISMPATPAPPIAARGSSPGPAQLPPLSPAIQPAPPSSRAGSAVIPRPVRTASSDSAERAALSTPAPATAAGARAVQRPAAPAVARTISSNPANPVTGPRSASPPAAPRDEAGVLDLLSRQQWDQARTALHQLSARDPNSRRLRALACYARGREAQLEGRVDDARVELHDALDLDPDLPLAKTALTELFTRRK